MRFPPSTLLILTDIYFETHQEQVIIISSSKIIRKTDKSFSEKQKRKYFLNFVFNERVGI